MSDPKFTTSTGPQSGHIRVLECMRGLVVEGNLGLVVVSLVELVSRRLSLNK